MPRTLGSNFTTEKNKVSGAEPFLTAIIRFGSSRGGDLALIGRSIAALGGTTPVIGGITHYAVVKSWGTLGSGFGSQQDGAPDLAEATVTCSNFPVIAGYRLSDRFVAELETIPVDLFWNFLSGSSVYQEDGPSGSCHSPTTFGFREATLRITSLMDTYLQRKVLEQINHTDFPNAPQGSLGAAVPLAIGNTTAADVDGARIPAVVVDTTQPGTPISGGVNTYALIACEAPASGLTVTSIGSRYYQGHKIIEQDLSVDASGTSADFPLFGDAPGNSTQGRAEAFGYFDRLMFDPNSDDISHLGYTPFSPSFPLGDLGYTTIVQPFRYDYPVRLTNLRLGASRTDAYSLESPGGDGTYQGGVPSPLRPMAVKILDQDTVDQGGGGLAALTFNEPDKLNAQRYAEAHTPIQRYDSITRQTGSNAFAGAASGGAYASAHFPLHGWSPIVGKNYYAVYYVASGNSGVPDDPGNQFYSIKHTATPFTQDHAGGFGDPTTFPGKAFAIGQERVFSPSFPGYTTQLKVTQFGNYIDMIADSIVDGTDGVTGNPEDGNNIGTSGIFQQGVEPTDTIVIAGITVYARQRLPSGSTTPIELKGSLTVAVNEVDFYGRTIGGSLASVSYSAQDFASSVTTSAYTPLFQFLSSPLLLEKTKKYMLTFQGELDASGSYGGWTLHGVTEPTFTGSGQTFAGRGSVLGGYLPQQPVTATDVSQPVSVRVTLHALKFDVAVESWPGFNAWTLRPYIRTVDKRFVLPDENAISFDAVCSLSRPDQVIHALLNRAGVPDARIDLAGTFTDSGTLYASHGYLFRGAVTEQQNFKALIPRLTFEARSDFDWEFHKAQLKWLPQPGDEVTSARTLTLRDIPPLNLSDQIPDFHVSRTETDNIVNVVNIEFQRMFYVSGRDAYLLADTFASLPSLAVHGPKKNDELFQLNFVRDVSMATEIGLFYVLWLSYALPKPIFTTKLQTVELMKGDIITLDLSPITGSPPPGDVLGGGGTLGDGGFLGDTSGAFNGWTDQPVLIRAIQIDWETQRIQYTAVVP